MVHEQQAIENNQHSVLAVQFWGRIPIAVARVTRPAVWPRGAEPDTAERQQPTERRHATHAGLHQCPAPSPIAAWAGTFRAYP